MSFIIERIPSLVAAVAMLALAIWVVWLRPKDPLHWTFGMLLGVRALAGSVIGFTGDSAVALRILLFAIILLPFLIMDFAWLLARRYSTRRHRIQGWNPWVRGALVVTMVATLLWYAFAPDLFIQGNQLSPIAILDPLMHILYAVVALVTFMEYRATPPGALRNSLLVLSLAFATQAVFRPFQITTELLASEVFGVATGTFTATELAIHLSMRIVGILATLVLAVALARTGYRGDAVTRSQATRYLAILALPALNGIIVAVMGLVAPDERNPYAWTLYTSTAVWALAFVFLAGYGIVRYQLFNIELQARFVLKQGTLISSIAVLFLILSEVIESLIAIPDNWSIPDVVASVGAALLLAALFRPLQRAAERVTVRLMPGVEHSEEYGKRRMVQLYRAAYEGAVKDGVITDKEMDVLVHLRRELGISPQQARHVEKEVRTA